MFGRSRSRGADRPPKSDAPETPATPINLRRLFGYLRPYRLQMSLALLALLGYSALGLVFPLVIVKLLGSVLAPPYDSGALDRLTLILVGVFLVTSVLNYVQSYLLTYIGENMLVNLRTQLYTHLQALSLEFYANRRIGELVSRTSSDITLVRAVLTTNFTQALSSIISLVGSIVIVFVLDPGLTVFILVLVVVIAALAIGFGRSFQNLSTAVQDSLADSTVIFDEGLQGIRVVKSFAREPYEIGRYTDSARKVLKAALRLAVVRSGFVASMSFLGFAAIASLLWFGGHEVIAGRLTLALISGFLIYAITIAGSVGGLAGLYGQIREALGGIRRVFEILDTVPSVKDAPDAKTLNVAQGKIAFQDVSFQYDPRIAVLEHIAVTIQPGEIVALVGPSGAGKSTLFNLIPRFYDPTAGQVQIDDQDLRGLTQASIRDQIGVVPQETLLFGGTVHDNIAYGRLSASEADIVAAAKAANADEFIDALPDKYQTIVGERGIKLSGGQRQRIAIARAILKDPRILLLDEATSSLDNESEHLVQEALERLMQNRTTVIIAHRLSTIKVAHRIIVLDHGQIVELGTHEELIVKDGLYARLYNMQFRDPEALLSTTIREPEPIADSGSAGGRASRSGLSLLSGLSGRR